MVSYLPLVFCPNASSNHSLRHRHARLREHDHWLTGKGLQDVGGASLGLHLDGERLGYHGQEAVQQADLVDGSRRVHGLRNGTVADGREHTDAQHGGQVLGAGHREDAAKEGTDLGRKKPTKCSNAK